jgi:GNAT superfamily N-acetyltransferase
MNEVIALDFTIRAATEKDYPTIVSIGRSATSDYVQSVEDLQFWDKARASSTISGKLVAVASDNQIIGTASYAQSAPEDDPRKFNIWIFVPPHLQGNTIGKSLYERITAELTPYKPRCLETGVRTDLPRAVRFLEQRGFVEVMREYESHLDLTTFNPDIFMDDLLRVGSLGITIKTLTELNNDPERDAKLYELHVRRREEAMDGSKPLPSLEQWRERFWHTPRLLPNGFCVAIDGEKYIGQSNDLASGIPTELEYGYTGVLRAYRNQGIARAMKLYVLRWAKIHGYTLARSWSNSRNEPMIRVNLHLGFVGQPAVLWMEKLWSRDG